MNSVELPKKGDIFITPNNGLLFAYNTDDRTPKNERRAGLKPQLNIFLGVTTRHLRKGSNGPTDFLVYWNSKKNKVECCWWGTRQAIRSKGESGCEKWLQKDEKGRWFLQSRPTKKDCPVLLEWVRQNVEQ